MELICWTMSPLATGVRRPSAALSLSQKFLISLEPYGFALEASERLDCPFD
jgi:hypothetical protein